MRSPHYTTAGIIVLAFALTALLVRVADIVIYRLLGRQDDDAGRRVVRAPHQSC